MSPHQTLLKGFRWWGLITGQEKGKEKRVSGHFESRRLEEPRTGRISQKSVSLPDARALPGEQMREKSVLGNPETNRHCVHTAVAAEVFWPVGKQLLGAVQADGELCQHGPQGEQKGKCWGMGGSHTRPVCRNPVYSLQNHVVGLLKSKGMTRGGACPHSDLQLNTSLTGSGSRAHKGDGKRVREKMWFYVIPMNQFLALVSNLCFPCWLQQVLLYCPSQFHMLLTQKLRKMFILPGLSSLCCSEQVPTLGSTFVEKFNFRSFQACYGSKVPSLYVNWQWNDYKSEYNWNTELV